jgi:uncharacterized hydrophobic protein (TIGR00271 family)
MSIRSETDYEKTREGIIRDIPFRGHTIYILICSIFIASIGLNLNSPAVIIGAMLIAPLMGPILGIGFSLGTNDEVLMKKSLKNFGVMVFISLFTSTVYFWITPLVEYQPELLARTRPTTLDIFVAIFGGAAGIIAGSRKEKSNVIPGVAIATALMPPLCTSGFGLATGNWPFFFGAFYLFFLNSIFICAATVVGVRYLRFPLSKYVNPKREKQVKIGMAAFMIVIIMPSLWIFWGVLRESWFKSHAETYISKVVQMEGAQLVNKRLNFNDSLPTIELFMIGENIPDDTILAWQRQLPDFGLESCQLQVYDNSDSQAKEMELLSNRLQQTIRTDILGEIYEKNAKQVETREERIRALEKELLLIRKNEVRIQEIGEELRIQFENLKKLSYAPSIETQFGNTLDTIPTFLVEGNGGSRSSNRKQEQKMAELMKVRLKLDTVRVISY